MALGLDQVLQAGGRACGYFEVRILRADCGHAVHSRGALASVWIKALTFRAFGRPRRVKTRLAGPAEHAFRSGASGQDGHGSTALLGDDDGVGHLLVGHRDLARGRGRPCGPSQGWALDKL